MKITVETLASSTHIQNALMEIRGNQIIRT